MSKFSNYYSRQVNNPYHDYDFIEDPLSNNDISFLAAASKFALTSTYRFRMAALVVKSGRVLGGDVNLPKITPSTPPNRVSTHAEMRVLKNTRNVRGATLYVARLRSENIPALARPCSWCMQQILDSDISRVVFTTNDNIGSSFYVDMMTWK